MTEAGFLGEVGSWSQVILGVGMLIFIHELGHFLVAKWAGVKVLAFSLGFGPVVWGFRRGDTHYRLSAIPLGGYVKMSGEVELPEGGYGPDDYPSKPVWVRSLIILAGVVMNAILGFVLFATALAVGVRLVPVEVGSLQPGSAAWEAGLRRGDRIVKADGRPLVEFGDLIHAMIPGDPVELTVTRGGEVFTRRVTPRVPEGGGTPAIGVGQARGDRVTVREGSPAAGLGFRTGDRVVAVDGVDCSGVDFFADPDLSEIFLPYVGAVEITVDRAGKRETLALPSGGRRLRLGITPLRDRIAGVRPGGAAEAAGVRAGDRVLFVGESITAGALAFRRAVIRAGRKPVAVGIERDGRTVTLRLPEDPAARIEFLTDLHFAEADSPTAVEVELEGPAGTLSPASMAGIPSGARITRVDDAPVTNFRQIAERVGAAGTEPVTIAWEHGDDGDEAEVRGSEYPVFIGDNLDGLAIETNEELLRLTSPGEIAAGALDRCLATTRNIGATVAGIFGGRVDKSNLGGPILIAQVAHRSSKSGAGLFFWILAMLSINLMFLNVLPIPLLDGGQLALLGVEAVTGKPPSESVVGIAQMTGLVLLLGLMVMVTFNDILRTFAG